MNLGLRIDRIGHVGRAQASVSGSRLSEADALTFENKRSPVVLYSYLVQGETRFPVGSGFRPLLLRDAVSPTCALCTPAGSLGGLPAGVNFESAK